MLDSHILKDDSYKLIVTIVKRGSASKVVAASKKAGAEGGTILLGRGTASKEIYFNFLGVNNEIGREVILTFVKESQVDAVLQAIADGANLYKPGNGIGFIIDIKEIAGIFHLLKTQQDIE